MSDKKYYPFPRMTEWDIEEYEMWRKAIVGSDKIVFAAHETCQCCGSEIFKDKGNCNTGLKSENTKLLAKIEHLEEQLNPKL